MRFVLFHGSFGGPKENWLPWLRRELEKLGQEVLVPEFPVEDWDRLTAKGEGTVSEIQTLQNWLKVFEVVAKSFEKGEKLCFIGHSIGPLFILHAVSKWKIQLDSAIFASPFLTDLGSNAWQFLAVNNSFYKSDFDFELLRKLIPVSYVLYGDNDPYVPRKFPIEFAQKLGSQVEVIPNGGHLNQSAGFKEFPRVLELCKERTEK